MRRWLSGAVLSFAITACGGSTHGAQVDPAEAHALVERGATLLDVRTVGEWEAGHLEGAVRIPIDELDARLGELPADRPVVVYCASGTRSAQAVSLLRARGLVAHDLGGMSRWGG